MTGVFALMAFSQEQQTYRQDGHVLVYTPTMDPNGSFKTITNVTLDDRAIDDETSKNALECAIISNTKCCSLGRDCLFCCNNPVCGISWYIGCLFNWITTKQSSEEILSYIRQRIVALYPLKPHKLINITP